MRGERTNGVLLLKDDVVVLERLDKDEILSDLQISIKP